jgi:hypothetical protein
MHIIEDYIQKLIINFPKGEKTEDINMKTIGNYKDIDMLVVESLGWEEGTAYIDAGEYISAEAIIFYHPSELDEDEKALFKEKELAK